MEIVCKHCNTSHYLSDDEIPLETKTGKCKQCSAPITLLGKNALGSIELSLTQSTPPEPEATKNCDFCGEKILAIAKKCKHCGSDLENRTSEKTIDYGMFLLAIPVVATMLIWFWVSGMNLFQSPSDTMSLIMLFTVLGTAIVAAMEASKVGMKSDRNKGTYSSTAWFFIITLLWIIGYPIYLFKRKHYGLDNRLISGIFVTLVFVGSWVFMSSAIEDKKLGIRSKLENTVIPEPVIQTTAQEPVTQVETPEPVVEVPIVQKNTIQAPITQAAIQVSSIQIANDYEQNEARADSIYKGKLLHVTGTITRISKDFTNSTVLGLQTTNEFNNVHAELEKSEEQKAINLQKGNEVTVQCQGNGEVVSTPMLNKCTFISKSEKTDVATPLKLKPEPAATTIDISADKPIDADPENAEQHIQKMLKDAINNDESSIQASKQYLENQPKPAKGDKTAARKINEEALKLIQSQQYVQALPLLAKATQIDPSDVEILNNYGFVLMKSRNLDKALSILTNTLTIKPDRASGWANLADVLALQGHVDLATGGYMNVYRFSGNREKIYKNLQNPQLHEDSPYVREALTNAIQKIIR